MIIEVTKGSMPFRIFFSTDAALTPVQVLQRYQGHLAIEAAFHDMKQLLGFGQSPPRRREAVERTTPMIGLCLTLLVVWQAGESSKAEWPLFPLTLGTRESASMPS